MVLEFPGSGGQLRLEQRERERSELEEERDKGKGCLKRKGEDLGEGSVVGEEKLCKTQVRGMRRREEEVANGRLLEASRDRLPAN